MFDGYDDRMITQTRPWINYILNTQDAELVVAIIEQNRQPCGCFTGFIINKCGVRILGSPFNGWGTPYMGFNLVPQLSRLDVMNVFTEYVLTELSCHFFQITDRYLNADDANRLSCSVQFKRNIEIDLSKSEAELFANMSSACRRCIRKAEKSGVSIEEASSNGFAEEFYEQLKDVFLKQSLLPTFGVDRVRKLINSLYPTGNILLLRARDRDGRCIATGIFPGFNRHMHFWGGASWRNYQSLRPNESLMWYAMKYWKKRGVTIFDMVGWAPYKMKYGAYEIQDLLLMAARPKVLVPIRNVSYSVMHNKHKLMSYLKLKGSSLDYTGTNRESDLVS